MKKLLSIIMLSTSLTIIASCGKSKQTTLPTETPTPTESPTETPIPTEEVISAACEGIKDEDTKCTYEYDPSSSTAKIYITINGTHELYEDIMDGKKTKEEWNESVKAFNNCSKVLYDFFVSEGYCINVELIFLDDVLTAMPIFTSNNGETTYDIVSSIKDKSGWNTPTPEPTVEPTEKPDTTLTLLKKNGITIKTDTDRLKYSSDINLEVKNNSGKDIIMRITDLSIDDEMADCYYHQTIKDRKKSTESLKIYDSNFYEGSEIEFTVEVKNKKYHTLFTKTVKFTVPKDEEE